MIAVDTNVLLRYVLQDELALAAKARRKAAPRFTVDLCPIARKLDMPRAAIARTSTDADGRQAK